MRTFFCLALALAFAACDTQGLQRDFLDDAEHAPNAFTRTTPEGEVVSTDPDDWRTAPLYAGDVTIDPPYPNPTSGAEVRLPFLVHTPDAFTGGLALYAYNCCNPDRPRLLFLAEEDLPRSGFFDFFFRPEQLALSGSLSEVRGLHRLFIVDVAGNVVSYGDLLVE